MKILLVEPPRGQWFYFGDVVQPNSGYAQLAAFIEQYGYPIEILDCQAAGVTWKNFWPEVEKRNPDIVGIGAQTCFAENAYRALREIKKNAPRIITVAGGAFFSFLAEESLTTCDAIDFVVRGEGELSFLELLRTMENGRQDFSQVKGLSYRQNGGVVHTPARPLIDDLDTLPMPAYHLLPMDRYHFRDTYTYTTVNTSRGCPYRCIFCSAWKFYGQTWRSRSARKVVDEMELLHKEYGIQYIMFGDDNFNHSRHRNEVFLSELARRKLNINWMMEARMDTVLRDADLLPLMKKSGLFYILFGAETGREEDLIHLKKEQSAARVVEGMNILNRLGISTIACFIVGLRSDTPETVAHTIRYAKSLDPSTPIFLALTPFPGTDLYEAAKAGGWIEIWDWDKYDFAHAVMNTETLSIKEVQKLLRRAYIRFWLRPSALFKRLFSDNYWVKEPIISGFRRKIKFLPPKDPYESTFQEL